MLIVSLVPEDIGWSPIRHMVSVATRLFDAELLVLNHDRPSSIRVLASVLRQRIKSDERAETCLLISPGPEHLLKILDVDGWRNRFRFLGAWIIDSFWLNHFPRSIRFTRIFDHFFVTSLDDLEGWQKLTGVPVTWLPWGTDALDLGSARSDREWDVTRVGRQPPEWDDDAVSITEANAVGIRFGGRPTMTGMSSLENLRYLMQIYGNSKYVLAFSNSVNRENYTHPTREYLTGRWVDALACGATVAGIAPGGRANVDLLWPGATLDLGSTARSVGLAKLTTAVKGWKAQHAVNNHFMALKKLDWRWRFQTIANTCGVVPPKLRQELLGLEHRLACDVGVTGSKGTAEDTKRD